MRKLSFILLFVFAMSICGCSESYAGGRQEAAPSAASSRIPEEKPLTEGPTYYFDVEEVYKMYGG